MVSLLGPDSPLRSVCSIILNLCSPLEQGAKIDTYYDQKNNTSMYYFPRPIYRKLGGRRNMLN